MKQTIKINEATLKKIVAESVKRTLNEESKRIGPWAYTEENLEKISRIIKELGELWGEFEEHMCSLPSACTPEMDKMNYEIQMIDSARKSLQTLYKKLMKQ